VISSGGIAVDPLKMGFDGVLMQSGRVVAYALRKLKIHGKNYSTHELELAAVVLAFKVWGH
jgi:hypothetical protein